MKKVSIHIGLNEVNPQFYGGWNGKLNGCLNDSENMSSVFFKQDFKCYMLQDEEATILGVLGLIDITLSELESGDKLIITYSGHGTQQIDTNLDEIDGRDEAICLYDGILTDDRINNAFRDKKRGVDVFLMFDSCHSGTAHRASDTITPRSAPNGISKLFDWVKTSRKRKRMSVTLLSGCKDNELSYEENGQGRFTKHVCEILNEKGNMSPRRLRRLLLKRISGQTPQLSSLGYKSVERHKIF